MAHPQIVFAQGSGAGGFTGEIERQLIAEVLAATGGNRKRAADELLLELATKALLYKLKQVEAEYPPVANKNGVAI